MIFFNRLKCTTNALGRTGWTVTLASVWNPGKRYKSASPRLIV